MKLKKMKVKKEFTLRGSSYNSVAFNLRPTYVIGTVGQGVDYCNLGFRPFRSLK